MSGPGPPTPQHRPVSPGGAGPLRRAYPRHAVSPRSALDFRRGRPRRACCPAASSHYRRVGAPPARRPRTRTPTNGSAVARRARAKGHRLIPIPITAASEPPWRGGCVARRTLMGPPGLAEPVRRGTARFNSHYHHIGAPPARRLRHRTHTNGSAVARRARAKGHRPIPIPITATSEPPRRGGDVTRRTIMGPPWLAEPVRRGTAQPPSPPRRSPPPVRQRHPRRPLMGPPWLTEPHAGAPPIPPPSRLTGRRPLLPLTRGLSGPPRCPGPPHVSAALGARCAASGASRAHHDSAPP